jgi:hypothetical protein
MSEPALNMETVALEAADQVSDWVSLEEGQRVRLTFIPSGVWASILARQTAIGKGREAIRQRIEEGTSEDPKADCERLGRFEQELLQVAGEVVGYSLREIEDREPLRLTGDVLDVSELEALVLDGLFWPVHAAVMAAHWTDAAQSRALFRRWVG